VDVAAAGRAIRDGAGLVTLIYAQNETGVVQPVAEIAATGARARRVDARRCRAGDRQDSRRCESTRRRSVVDRGPQAYAPKGVGALYVRRGVRTNSVLRGAGQESGRRPGTENVASIVGLGRACRLAADRLRNGDAVRLEALTRDLFVRLQRDVPEIELTGHPDARLPNTLNVLFSRRVGPRPARCLSAGNGFDRLGLPRRPRGSLHDPARHGIAEHKALGAVRLSLGFTTTAADIAEAAAALADAWQRLSRAPSSSRQALTSL